MQSLWYLFKTFLLICLALLILFSGYGYCIDINNAQRIKSFTEKEYNDITKTLNSVKKEKDTIWANADISYYQKWLKGLEYERSGDYPSAIKWYKKASQVTRHEMSSYDVFLPLGRAYLLNEDCKNASKALQYFINEIKSEISGDVNLEWKISEEGKKALKIDLEDAQWLLSLCK